MQIYTLLYWCFHLNKGSENFMCEKMVLNSLLLFQSDVDNDLVGDSCDTNQDR